MALIGWTEGVGRNSEAHKERTTRQDEGIGVEKSPAEDIGVGKGPAEDRKRQKGQKHTAAWEDQEQRHLEGVPWHPTGPPERRMNSGSG